jgi:hypothetical protein
MLALGLGAALMIAAAWGTATASASGLEWGRCEETESQTGGKYANAGCTETAAHKQGAYEWEPRERVHLESMTAVGAVSFETAAGKKVECAAIGPESDALGLGPRGAGTPLWEFEGCTSEGEPCTATDAYPGEINDLYSWYGELWKGKLGYISGRGTADPTVGLSYEVPNHERLFEPVHCNGRIGTIWIGGAPKGRDAFLSTIGPVNEMTETFTQVYSESAPGVPSPTKFAGGRKQTLEAFVGNHWEPVAMIATFNYNTGRASEIKATR